MVVKLFQKLHLQIYASQFMRLQVIPLPLVLFCIWKVWKGREKIRNLENENSFFDEIKNTFHSFGRAIIWRKNKKLIKNSGHKL